MNDVKIYFIIYYTVEFCNLKFHGSIRNNILILLLLKKIPRYDTDIFLIFHVLTTIVFYKKK